MRHEPRLERVPRRLGFVALIAVTLAAAGPARAQVPAGDAACFPACRSGYLCHEGRCVSACNPPCGAAESCTAAGECVLAAPVAPPAPAVLVGDTPVTAVVPAHEVDPGWARGAFYFGAATVVVDVALTMAVVVTNPGQASTARNLGGISVAVFGATSPLIAMGGGSARNHPGVTGYPRVRVASWVGYVLTLADAAWLLARSHRKIIDDRYVLSVGVLGTLTTLGFALDARASAAQAEHLQATGLSHATIGFASGSGGGIVPTWGWGGAF